ncbi:hypothetical protein [Caldivirga maquilingensis]|uniref:Uncharacterized protein n=1 Tax=Caldivirga maquilingensis (strain ATCC 700844 / DSM 13496 / JCM 10307 / IC-167) TaxID=397948 RepID=A8ME85_CALMQ|nr:hypothetical protein [Caldivirga maquilingensis]ABW02091.1 hypothetical protein Cmaq_1264 [Caldivirga maquilingensis IC-167]
MKVIYSITDGRTFKLLVARRSNDGFTGVLEYDAEVEVRDGDLESVLALINNFIKSTGKLIITGEADVKFYKTDKGWLMLNRGQVSILGELTIRDILNALNNP